MKISKNQTRKVGLILGPVLFLLVAFFPVLSLTEELTFQARVVLAATLWMTVWWITEAIPIYVTALLPFTLFPTLGVTRLEETAASYADRVVFLFTAGFMLAKAIEKSNLHSRIALGILKVFGTNPKYIVAGFMTVIVLLGSWMSNTAITMLMLPVAVAVIGEFRDPSDREKFGLCLMLSVAYSASISGVATLISSPPNAIFASVSKEIVGIDVSFSQWMVVGFPIGLLSVLVAWLYMVNFGSNIRGIKPIAAEKGLISKRLLELGSMTRDEKLVIGVFAGTAIAWITRGLLWGKFVPAVDDSTIAVAAIFFLFLLPSSGSRNKKKLSERQETAEGHQNIMNATTPAGLDNTDTSRDNDDGNDKGSGGRLLNWNAAVQIPWGVLLLIGGGIALADAFTATGLDKLIAQQLAFLEGMDYSVIIFIMVTITALIGEVISNTATAALMIPISASVATSLGINPSLIMVPVTMVTSYSFIMPVSTPPNTIVFASGYVTIPKMFRAGLLLKIIGIVLITILSTLLVPFVWR